MEFHQIPPANFDLRGQSLREQMIARIRQIDSGFYRLSELERMSDYALLCTFEVVYLGIHSRTMESHGSEMFDAGIKYGQERMMENK